MTQDHSNQPESVPPAGRPKRSKLRLVLKIAGALFALIVLLIILAPTIASTGLVRNMVVNAVNARLNGQAKIDSWSLGWFSGISVQGVSLTDANGAHVLDVAKLSTGLSLLKAATGNIDLGDVEIDGVNFNGTRDSAGQINFALLVKPTSAPPSNSTPPAESAAQPPGKLPNIKGVIHLNNAVGSFQDDQSHTSVQLDSINATISIPDINQPIQDSLSIVARLMNQQFATVKVDGSVSAVQSGMVNVNGLLADQTVQLSGVDLAPISTLLDSMGLHLQVAGTVDGKIEAKVNTMDQISAVANVAMANMAVGGPQLNGDTVKYQQIQLNLNASRDASAGQSAIIKLDLPITATSAATTQPDQIAVHVDVPQDALLQTGNLLAAVANHVLKGQAATAAPITLAAGETGIAQLTVDFGAANLLSQLPNTAHLEQGTSLTQGRLTYSTTLTLSNNQADITVQTNLKNFAGTNAGKPITLADLNASVGLSAVGGSAPDLKNLNLNVAIPFLKFSGGGQDLGKTNFTGSIDFQSVQQQMAQFLDLDALLHAAPDSHVALSGTASFEAHTNGDLQAPDGTATLGATLTLADVDLSGIGNARPIHETKFTATIAGDLHHTTDKFIEAVHNLSLSLQSPAINFQTLADIKFGGSFGATVPSFQIPPSTIDLALLQDEFGGALSLFAPAPKPGAAPTLLTMLADNSARIVSGKIDISGKGEFDPTAWGFQEPLNVRVEPSQLVITDAGGATKTVNLPPIEFSASGQGTVDPQNVSQVKNLTAAITIGSSDAQLFGLTLSADATITPTQNTNADVGPAIKVTLPRIELASSNGDLPGLQSAFGPLLPLIMPPPVATAATQPSVLQAIAQNQLQVTSGKLNASFSGQFDGQTFAFVQPLDVSIADLTLQKTTADSSIKPITDQNLDMKIGGSLTMADKGIQSHLQKLAFNLGDNLQVQADPNNPIHFAVSPTGEISGGGTLQLVHADMAKLLDMAAAVLPPDQMASLRQLKSGIATGSVNLQQADNGALTAHMEFNVADLTVGSYLTDESVDVTCDGTMSADMTTISDAAVNVVTTLAKKISLTCPQIVLGTRQSGQLVPGDPLQMVSSADVEVDGLDLPKVYALLNLIQQPPSGGQLAGDVQAAPPLEVQGGVATIKAGLRRNADVMTASLSSLLVQNLSVKSGDAVYAWPTDITAQLSADAQINNPASSAQATALSELGKITVTTLSADLGFLKIGLSSNQPIQVTGISDPDTSQRAVQGGISVDGDIAPAARLAEVLGHAAANTYPYAGHYHFDESVDKDAGGSRLKLIGGGTVTQFQVLAPAAPASPGQASADPTPVFSESEIDIHNGLAYEPATQSVFIDPSNPVSLALKSTGALSLSVSGSVGDLTGQRQLNAVAIQLNYDLAALWTIIKPMLPPSQQQTLADLQITGHQQKTFAISGSFPSNVPFNQAVASLAASGVFTVDSLSTHGITIANFDFPFVLKGGILRTVYPDKPEGQNAPQPATCNDTGSLDIGISSVDLRGPDPLLTMEDATADNRHYLLKDVNLNKTLAKTLFVGILANPLFVDSSQCDGVVSVSVAQCKDVPLSALVNQNSPQNTGVAEVHYSAHQLQLGSPILALLVNGGSLSADIDDGFVHIEHGKATEDTTIMINQASPLRIVGGVILSSQTFDPSNPMKVHVPTSLMPNGLIPKSPFSILLPRSFVFTLKGNMNKPQLKMPPSPDWTDKTTPPPDQSQQPQQNHSGGLPPIPLPFKLPF